MGKKIIITNEHAGIRLDKFLVGEFFSFTRGELIRRIKEGKVTVNGAQCKPSFQLSETDVVETLFLDEREKQLSGNPDVKFEVIYEDKNLIVVNKPAGLQVHSSYGERNFTLVNGLIEKFPDIVNIHDGSEEGKTRPGIVHRLDKETSGVMIVAKTKEAFDELKRKFKDREVTKTYVAIVEGIIEQQSGKIDKAIARSSDYRKQIIARRNTKTKIRSAVTEYRVIKKFEKFSFVEVYPQTGRMHQIRVHFASIGHPVAGDIIYGTAVRGENTGNRHFLHAKNLRFELFGKPYEFSAPLPEDFLKFVGNID